jgi:hypothetical protein
MLNKEQILDLYKFNDNQLKLIEASQFKSQTSHKPARAIKVNKILLKFFNENHFKNKKILELGPGHFAFSIIARELGAKLKVIEIDKNFSLLGKSLGFEVESFDFLKNSEKILENNNIEGVWMKNTINGCLHNEIIIKTFINNITRIISRNNGWGFISTANKYNDNYKTSLVEAQEMQRYHFSKNGWLEINMDEITRRELSLHYNGGLIFKKNV